MTFVTTKTYFNLESAFSLPGVILFYGICGSIGAVFVYFFLPETEKRTLEDIEIYFSDNKRKLTDIHIERFSNQQKRAKETVTSRQGIENAAFTENEK